MSALMDRLLDSERLADIARNDALAGIAAPPVERDEFFARVDAAMLEAKSPAGQARILRRAQLAEIDMLARQGRQHG